MSVTYAAGSETGEPGTTNVVKPLYHVAWLASRLGLRVGAPLAPGGVAREACGVRTAATRARSRRSTVGWRRGWFAAHRRRWAS